MKAWLGVIAFCLAWAPVSAADPYSGKLFSTRPMTETIQEVMNLPSLPGRQKKEAASEGPRYNIVSLYTSAGVALFREKLVSSIRSQDFLLADPVDVDGDGKEDILVLTRAGMAFLKIEDANGTFMELPQGLLGLFSRAYEFVYPMKLLGFIPSDSIRDYKTLSWQNLGSKIRYIDLDHDGVRELFLMPANMLSVVRLVPGKIGVVARAWSRTGFPGIADLDGNGVDDIIVDTEGGAIFFLYDKEFRETKVDFPKTDNLLAAMFSDPFTASVYRPSSNAGVGLALLVKPMLSSPKLVLCRYDRATTNFIPFATNLDMPAAVAFRDLDGDGKDEMMAANGKMRIWRVNGGRLDEIKYAAPELDGESLVVWDRFDQDSTPDFLAINTATAFRNAYYYFNWKDIFQKKDLNDLIYVKWVETVVTNGGKTTNIVPHFEFRYRLMDLDNDGYRDLICWDDKRMNVLRNTLSGFRKVLELPFCNPDDVFRDIDGDGRLDYFNVSNLSAGVFRNTGTNYAKIQAAFPAKTEKILLWDINGDATNELLVVSDSGFVLPKTGVQVFAEKEPNRYEELKQEFIPTGGFDLVFADLDHDGKLDIVDISNRLVYRGVAGK